ncbi:hypothetical protein [Methylomagnum ishizawai]|uniref:hypothetical protein n=1 Tax=Methylomagnum ishizawai TaxID=1760988 RepID=UPI001C33A852|nr:hypothetical protein [Methylomagnum ishizawai]BBL76233.1 hypothetical protein MishRS11D_33310 [Methylomagnum ishizawai]
MSGNHLPTAREGRPSTMAPDRLAPNPFQLYFRLDDKTGRKDWFFTAGSQVFGPFRSFAEADEELAECRAINRHPVATWDR